MKEIFIGILLIIAICLLFASEFYTNPVPITGTSTAVAYTLDINMSAYLSGNLQIANTGVTNSIDIVVTGYSHPSASVGYVMASRTLLHGDMANIDINMSYYIINIEITETSLGNHSTYEINYILKR